MSIKIVKPCQAKPLFYVSVKESFLAEKERGFISNLGINSQTIYPVIGIVNDKFCIIYESKYGTKEFFEIYPKNCIEENVNEKGELV